MPFVPASRNPPKTKQTGILSWSMLEQNMTATPISWRASHHRWQSGGQECSVRGSFLCMNLSSPSLLSSLKKPEWLTSCLEWPHGDPIYALVLGFCSRMLKTLEPNMSCEIEHSGQICLCSMGFHAIMSSILSAQSFFRQKADCCPLTEDALGERSVYNSETGNLSQNLDVV